MTMRSYDDVDFRPWYLPDTARWLKLSLGARGLVAELVRKLDRHGRISLGDDPASDLAIILRVSEADARVAFAELVEAGRIMWDPATRVLSDPDLPARLRLGSAARMAKKRASDAAKSAQPSPPSQPVTSVTTGDVPSPSDLICSDLSGSDLKSRSDLPTSTPRATPTAVPDPPPSYPHNDAPRCATPVSLVTLASDAEPAWWPAACETVAATVAPVSDRAARWLEYLSSVDRRGLAPNQRHAVGWLSQVVRSERRNARPSKVDTRQPMLGPEPEWLTRAKSTGTDGSEPF